MSSMYRPSRQSLHRRQAENVAAEHLERYHNASHPTDGKDLPTRLPSPMTGGFSDTATRPRRSLPGVAGSDRSSASQDRIGSSPPPLKPGHSAVCEPYNSTGSIEGRNNLGPKRSFAGNDVYSAVSSNEQYEPTQAGVPIGGTQRPHESLGVQMARSYAQVVAEGIPRMRGHPEREPPMDDCAGEHDLKMSPNNNLPAEGSAARGHVPGGYEGSARQIDISRAPFGPESYRSASVRLTRHLEDPAWAPVASCGGQPHPSGLYDTSDEPGRRSHEYDLDRYQPPEPIRKIGKLRCDADGLTSDGLGPQWETDTRTYHEDAATSRTSVAADFDQARPEDWYYGTEGAERREWGEVLGSDTVEFVSDSEAPQQDDPASEWPVSSRCEAISEQENPYCSPLDPLPTSIYADADAWREIRRAGDQTLDHTWQPISPICDDIHAPNEHAQSALHSQTKRHRVSSPEEQYSAPFPRHQAGIQSYSSASQMKTQAKPSTGSDVGAQAPPTSTKRNRSGTVWAAARHDNAHNTDQALMQSCNLPTLSDAAHHSADLQDLGEQSQPMKRPKTSAADAAPAAPQKPSLDDFLKTCKRQTTQSSTSRSTGESVRPCSGLGSFMALRGAAVVPTQPPNSDVDALPARPQKPPGTWLKHPAIQNPGWYRKGARWPVEPQDRRSVLASMSTLRDRRLFRALDDVGLELIETLDGTQAGDIVLSTDTAVLIRSIADVEADTHQIKNEALVATFRYHRVIVVVKTTTSAAGNRSVHLEDPLTDTALAGLGRFKVAVDAIAHPDGKRIGHVEVVFANHGPTELARVLRCVMQEEEDAFERQHGSEKADFLWRERLWVQRDEDEGERCLVHECGINTMSAKFILHIAGSLDRLADLRPAKRLKAFAPIIGHDAATRLNEALRRKESARARSQALSISGSTSHSSPYM